MKIAKNISREYFPASPRAGETVTHDDLIFENNSETFYPYSCVEYLRNRVQKKPVTEDSALKIYEQLHIEHTYMYALVSREIESQMRLCKRLITALSRCG